MYIQTSFCKIIFVHRPRNKSSIAVSEFVRWAILLFIIDIFLVFVECLDRTVRGAVRPGAPLDVIMTPSKPRPLEAELVSYHQYYL